MVRTLLLRGMLAGLVAGLIVFAFTRWMGEPQVDRAIAFETSLDQARGEPAEPEMVSRTVQKGAGLLTGVVVYGAALGGIFGLVFAYARGRLSDSRPRVLAGMLACSGFVTIVLVPSLKYPANPPSVGSAETIGGRTGAYFLLIAFSIVVAAFAVKVRRYGSGWLGAWNGTLLAVVFYLCVAGTGAHFLPAVDEVPLNFPASLLWQFRMASLETQGVLWSVLGLLFGGLTERAEDATVSRRRA